MAATGTIILPIQGAKLPTSNAALIDAGEQNWRLLFPDSTDYSCSWQFRMPQDYSTGLKAFIQYSTHTGTNSGKVAFEVGVFAVTPGDSEDINTAAVYVVNSGNHTAPTTVGILKEMAIGCTGADSLAANDYVRIKLARDADDAANDTLTGHVEVVSFTLEYLTT